MWLLQGPYCNANYSLHQRYHHCSTNLLDTDSNRIIAVLSIDHSDSECQIHGNFRCQCPMDVRCTNNYAHWTPGLLQQVNPIGNVTLA